MDVREITQTVIGVLILSPDQALMKNALGNSVLLGAFFHTAQLSANTIAFLSLFHALVLILGIGLLIGVNLTISTAIAFFVGIGAGAGLFEAKTLLSFFGPEISFISTPINGTSNALVVYPFLSDIFLLCPIIVLALGIFVWRKKKIAKKLRTKNAVDLQMRHYCMTCGAHVEPGEKICNACGTVLTRMETDSFCTDCGRPLHDSAKFCAYCGEEILKGGSIQCAKCGEPTSSSARYCHSCGIRLSSRQKDRSPQQPAK
jgi:hypothetical protein